MVDESTKKKVIDWIQENQEELVKLTQDLVRIPSVSGEECDVQKRIHRELDGMGLDPEMFYPDETELRKHEDFFETTSFAKFGYENRPNVGAVIKGAGGGRSLCLSGHVDVVSPEPLNRWSRNPWSGEVSQGAIHGRGSGDMKAGVAANIFAVKALLANNIKLKGDVQIETTIEEEDGGVGGVLYMRTIRPKTDAALIPEPSNHAISLASAGVMYFRVTVPGRPAHAATAHFGVNAIQKMMPVIDAIEMLHRQRQKKIHYELAETDPRMKGRATTINIGTIRAGDWPSTVPGNCVIEGRIGFPPGETREHVMAQVDEAVGAVMETDDWLKENAPKVTWFGWRARPHEISKEEPFVQQVRALVRDIVGVEPAFIGGSAGLDTRYFVHQGTPALTCGPNAERIHSYDEIVTIDSTVKSSQIIASTMLDWCGLA